MAKVMARIDIEQFKGYCFYCIRLKDENRKVWKKAHTIYGRCDTIEQGYGYAKQFLGDLNVDLIGGNTGATKWAILRQHLKAHGESYREEGSVAWASIDSKTKENLHAMGVEYKAILDVIIEKQREAARIKWEAGAEERERQSEEFRKKYCNSDSTIDFESFLKNLHYSPKKQSDLSILGLNSNASKEDIKTAFRRLANKYHPDKQGGNQAKFIEVRAAYERLI